ncbi:hypothetical protein F441_22710 [Phytophthora nicotianae CJ01A1]|uniref:Uncharacterized protein n=3 Tax=Phytophthora nicotianae TaxID=4792 RepID=W2VNW4_PHYNI|nr:hypothetical protein L916_14400 [Phytophthora nicotianae]ETO68235.1 hypothetical protein F444_14910 [Phytophthora nicotianae P1976]ETO99870.1 hypothetical protein F441_22710 [Phytophthora nicotianae CJ01A1]
MPRGTAKGGAKEPAKTAGGKAQAKRSKRHSKGLALKEATKVVSEVDASGASAASKLSPQSVALNVLRRPSEPTVRVPESTVLVLRTRPRPGSSTLCLGAPWKGTLQCPASTALPACIRSLVITSITVQDA